MYGLPDDFPIPDDSEFVKDEQTIASDGGILIDTSDGIAETLHFDEGEQKFHLRRVEDVESVLDWCKGRYSEGLVNRYCEFRHVGRYPFTVVQIFAKRWGFDDPWAMLKNREMVDRLIADSELSYFRTLPGNYSRRV